MHSKSSNKASAGRSNKSDNGQVFSRNDNIIFLICIIIGAVFWGLIKLSEVYTENFIFKINYLNIPAEKQLTRLADSTLNVNVEANGFSILKHYLFDEANKLLQKMIV